MNPKQALKLFQKGLVIIVAVAGLIFAACIAEYSYDKYKSPENKLGPFYADISNANWPHLFSVLVRDKKISLEDLEKISFALPEDAGFGARPDYEFFNPAGKIAQREWGKGGYFGSDVEALADERNSRFIFNIWRYEADDGGVTDYLVALLPLKHTVYSMGLRRTLLINLFGEDVNIIPDPAADNSTIVIDRINKSPPQGASFPQMGRQAYAVLVLLKRAKKAAGAAWE